MGHCDLSVWLKTVFENLFESLFSWGGCVEDWRCDAIGGNSLFQFAKLVTFRDFLYRDISTQDIEILYIWHAVNL